jgi:hypothetical protein
MDNIRTIVDIEESLLYDMDALLEIIGRNASSTYASWIFPPNGFEDENSKGDFPESVSSGDRAIGNSNNNVSSCRLEDSTSLEIAISYTEEAEGNRSCTDTTNCGRDEMTMQMPTRKRQPKKIPRKRITKGHKRRRRGGYKFAPIRNVNVTRALLKLEDQQEYIEYTWDKNEDSWVGALETNMIPEANIFHMVDGGFLLCHGDCLSIEVKPNGGDGLPIMLDWDETQDGFVGQDIIDGSLLRINGHQAVELMCGYKPGIVGWIPLPV